MNPLLKTFVVFAIFIGVLLTGCGQKATTDKPKADATVNGDGSFQGTKADKARAGLAVLDSVSQLPKGWRPVPTKGRLSGPPGHPSYCGVSAEPASIRQSALTMYEESPSERRVLQFTFVSTEKDAKEVMDRLVPAARKCVDPGYVIKAVNGFTQVGDESVALSYDKRDASSEAAVFRVHDTVVVLVGYGAAGVPERPLQEIASKIGESLAD